MKNDTNDGVYCDYCGDECKGDFTYYSFDFYRVVVSHQMARQAETAEASADICERCMELFRQRLIEIGQQSVETPTRCDVCGVDPGPVDRAFYKCKIASAKVNISNQLHACTTCNKPRDPQDGPCPCGGTKLERRAAVVVDNEYVQLTFCEESLAKFNNHTQHIKGLGEAEWSNRCSMRNHY